MLLEALRYRLAATTCTTTHVVARKHANKIGLKGVEKRRQQALEARGTAALNVKRFHCCNRFIVPRRPSPGQDLAPFLQQGGGC